MFIVGVGVPAIPLDETHVEIIDTHLLRNTHDTQIVHYHRFFCVVLIKHTFGITIFILGQFYKGSRDGWSNPRK